MGLQAACSSMAMGLKLDALQRLLLLLHKLKHQQSTTTTTTSGNGNGGNGNDSDECNDEGNGSGCGNDKHQQGTDSIKIAQYVCRSRACLGYSSVAIGGGRAGEWMIPDRRLHRAQEGPSSTGPDQDRRLLTGDSELAKKRRAPTGAARHRHGARHGNTGGDGWRSTGDSSVTRRT